MSNTDFEGRLRGHLAVKAKQIEVPEHKFVQTKVVPFQPRQRRFTTGIAVAAGLAIVAMLGFGVFGDTNETVNQANLGPLPGTGCSLQLIAGEPGFLIDVYDNSGMVGSYASDENHSLDLRFPMSFEVHDSSAPGEEPTVAHASADSIPQPCRYQFQVKPGGALELSPAS